jgi:hypothetical protein
MNRKNLTAAVLAGLAGAAGIAGTAQAVNLNPDGLGQVLIYPYYTVNGGNFTLLSVVNTSDQAKAVKVRFLEGQNSNEVLDFNLYMSAYDVWAAAIVDDAGTPTLFVDDESCTVPDLYRDFGGSQAFLTFALDDEGSTDISRTAEGHFEMIEMGTLVGSSAVAATHEDGVPPDSNIEGFGDPRPCGQLVDAWTQGPDGDFGTDDDGYWIDEAFGPLTDIEHPSGGLFGGAAIVHGEKGTMFSYDARAINGFASDRAPFGNPLHSFPGTEAPSLNDGDNWTGFVFTDTGDIASAEFLQGVDAVSFVFMHDALMNEYNVETGLGALSEWVITFPTKNFYVNNGGGVAPFISTWSSNFPEEEPDEVKDGACEPVLLDKVWDREEQDIFQQSVGDDCPPIVSPGPPVQCGEPFVPFRLCWETNVVRFGDIDTAGDVSDIFGSSNFTNVDTGDFENGWARIDMMRYQAGNVGAEEIFIRDPLGADTGFDGDAAFGLPVTGFWALAVVNTFLGDGNDVVANYGGLFDHKATRCFSGEGCRVSPD